MGSDVRRGADRWVAPVALLAVPLTAAALVVHGPLAGSPAALVAVVALAGSVPLLGGAVVLALGLRLPGRWRTSGRTLWFRILLGTAAVLFGLGQLMAAWEVREGYPGYPLQGDVVSGTAMLPAVVGLALLLRRTQEVGRSLRLVLEGLMTGCAASLLLWRTVMMGVASGPGVELSTFTILVLEVVLAAIAVLAAIRELDRGLLLLAAGFALYTTNDVVAIHQVVQGGPWPWQNAAAGCVFWPLIIAGLMGIGPRPRQMPDRRLPAAETRRQVVVGVLSTGMLTCAVLTFRADPEVDAVALTLLTVFALALGCCELVRASQNRRLLERLGALAQHDPLTGVLNRRALSDRLDDLAVGRPGSRAHESGWWFLTLDLDGFKDVNDVLGHETGDLVLQLVAKSLEERLAPHGAEVFRLGGDEFGVLAPGTETEIRALAEALLLAVSRSVRGAPGVTRLEVSVSIGADRLRLGRGEARQTQVGIAASGQAMRQAKRDGRGRVVVFSEPLAARSRRRRLMERQLRDTVATGGVDVHFQPVYDVWTGYLTGVEALARWNDPVLGEVSPGEFVEIAEEAGLIGEMGEQILRKALRLMVGCGAVARGVRVAVNVSTIQLRDPRFVGVVVAALEEAGVEAGQLIVEVTESVFVRPDDPAVQSITRLAELGCPVAMDDFGSGYSSLGYLSRLPVRILKADMSLTQQLHEPRTLAIGRTIVQLATGLGLDVVFEGVSTPQQEALVRGLGAQFVQGWLYSRAMPVEELVAEMDRSCAPVPGAAVPLSAPRPRRPTDGRRWASTG